MNDLDQRIGRIEERNQRVELDKGWETSWTRRILLTLFTYLAVAIYLIVIGVAKPWINAIVPAVAFMISSLTMPLFKNIWLRKGESKKYDNNK